MCNGDATSVTNTGVCRSPAGWDIGQVSWPTPAAPATSAPVVALGKRRREEPQGVGAPISNPLQKRSRGNHTKGILKATRSADRARHKSVARIPITMIKYEPKEPGRGAERLATPNTQGVQHRPLQGPSFQQGWGGTNCGRRANLGRGECGGGTSAAAGTTTTTTRGSGQVL